MIEDGYAGMAGPWSDGPAPSADNGFQSNLASFIKARLDSGHSPGSIAVALEQVQPGLGRALIGELQQAAMLRDHQSQGAGRRNLSPPLLRDAAPPGDLNGDAEAASYPPATLQGLSHQVPRPSALSDLPQVGFGAGRSTRGLLAHVIAAEAPDREHAGPPAQTDPSPTRSVKAITDGVVGAVGWQNPKAHQGENAGMGWRIYINSPDGSRIGYGHMEPGSTLKPGTKVKAGDVIGRYADPTNGHSDGPHVHVQKFDAQGRIVDPGSDNPLIHGGSIRSRFGAVGRLHKKPHQGVDWGEDK